MNKNEVEFVSGGETIRGDLYLPKGEGPFPTVVMAGGWCYVKELRQPQYAHEFVERGFAALIFDYRNLGASEGEPRQHLNPWDQIEDYKNAITFAEGLPEVDANRIGAWGISYSGGHVTILGAIDPRLKAIVANVPVIDGYQTMWRVHGSERFRLLQQLALDDRRKRAASGEHGYMGMSATPHGLEDELTVWPFDEVRDVFVELKATQAPRHEHRNTIASTEMLMNYSVFPFVPRILNVSTLMIIADEDDLTLWDKEIEAFKAIGSQDKELFVTPTVSHMELYSDKTSLELAAEKAAGFFERKLLARQPVTA